MNLNYNNIILANT